MRAASKTHKLSGHERRGLHPWYFLTIGVVCGAAVIAAAVLPQQIAGFTLVLVLVLLSLVDLLARRFSTSPASTRLRRGRWSIAYVVALGAVLVGAFALDWAIVRRGDVLWLAWTMAGLVFVVLAGGAWAVDGRSTSKETSVY